MNAPLIESFADTAKWLAVASGEATLHLADDAGELRMDFDFADGKGFVVARRTVDLTMPEAFTLHLQVRGDAPVNHLELKFEDGTKRNVWRWQQKDIQLTENIQTIAIERRDIEFAWGPKGGGAIDKVAAVEIAIVASEGGVGTVWISNLDLEDRSIREAPVVTVSTGDASAKGWQSAPGDAKAWWQIDFRGAKELGGLILRWGKANAAKGFVVETIDDGANWTEVWRTTEAVGLTSYVRLPNTTAHGLRLKFAKLEGDACVVLDAIEVQQLEFGRTLDALMHAIAADSPRGWMPRYWCHEQSYWTPVALPQGGPRALINEEGLIECGEHGFSLEPMIRNSDGSVITWADATTSVSLAEEWMPLPTVTWQTKNFELRISAQVIVHDGLPTLQGDYDLQFHADAPKGASLVIMIRPFQVTPPWQHYRNFGGMGSITEIAITPQEARVNKSVPIRWTIGPDAFVAQNFQGSLLIDRLLNGNALDDTARDSNGSASAAMEWCFTANAAQHHIVRLMVPLLMKAPKEALVEEPWVDACGTWRVTGNAFVSTIAHTWRTCLAHILINRDGARLQPGPRRYTRCWIRDAAGMAAMLLRAGRSAESRELLLWYTGFQREEGLIPCCVDQDGADWLIEYDSLGQFIFAVREHYRFTGDVELVKTCWPAVQKALRCMEQLRATRMTLEYAAPEKRARFGLLPESASHEGYLAQPVHSYWDDFWALRGIRDASEVAALLGDDAESARLLTLYSRFSRMIGQSLAQVIRDRAIDYLPGSVEWADFDPNATSNAIDLLDKIPGVNDDILHRTFDKYMTGFRNRVAGRTDWSNYTAYEIRIIQAMIRLGRRDDALELLSFFLSDRRPLAWNQWPEISWRDPRSPGHIGDVPHTWIGSEYARSARHLFVYETEHSLVLAAGVSFDWLTGPGIKVENLPTPHGLLSYELKQQAQDTVVFTLHKGITLPAEGLTLRLPEPYGDHIVSECPMQLNVRVAYA